MVIPFLFAIPIIGIVGIENMSTCIILLAISFIMIFVATPLFVPFAVIGLIGVAGAGGLEKQVLLPLGNGATSFTS